MGVVEDFTTEFHNLQGITIGERRKNFNNLLKQYSDVLKDENHSRAILANITPQYYMEHVFRVEFLIYCQLVPELLNILKGGNEAYVKQVIRHDWFITKAFANLRAREIVEDLLPGLSFSMKMKLFKKFVLFLQNDNKIEQLFDLVKQKYGLKFALPLLLGCKEEKVMCTIQNNIVILAVDQLKQLVIRYPKLLPIYVEKHMEHEKLKGGRTDKSEHWFLDNYILRLVESRDYCVYKLLTEKYDLRIKYGRRITKKKFDTEKNHILSDPTYGSRFEKRALVRKLLKNGCLKQYLLSAFPYVDYTFSYNLVSDLLQYVPRNLRFKIFQECFDELNKVPLLQIWNKINISLLELIPDAKIREEIAIKLMTIEDNPKYIAYQTTENSIPLIKKAMNYLDISEASRLLVHTCKVNNNIDALVDVSKYIGSLNNRNLELYFFESVLFYFKPLELPFEMLEMCLKFDEESFNIKLLLPAYIEVIYMKCDFTKELLLKWLKRMDLISLFAFETKNYQFIKDMVENSLELYVEYFEYKSLRTKLFSILCHVNKWNKLHPEYSIDYFRNSRLMDAIKWHIENDFEFISDAPHILFQQGHKECMGELVNLYMEQRDCYVSIDNLSYVLKWYPHIVAKYPKTILNKYEPDSTTAKHLADIKKYDYLELPQILISEIQLIPPDLQYQYIQILSILMSPEDYVSHVNKQRNLIAMRFDHKEILDKLKNYIINSFKYIHSPVVLPLLLTYCGADDAKKVVSPLHKIFYHVPENDLSPHLCKIHEVLGRHALQLALKNCCLDKVKQILVSRISIEEDFRGRRTRRAIVLAAWRCFLEHGFVEAWCVFKENIQSALFCHSFYSLLKQTSIPAGYANSFLKEMWNMMMYRNRYGMSFVSLVQVMEKHIELLSYELCVDVVSELFSHFSWQGRENRFISTFLLMRKEPNRFNKIIELCSMLKNTLSQGLHDNGLTARIKLCIVLKYLYIDLYIGTFKAIQVKYLLKSIYFQNLNKTRRSQNKFCTVARYFYDDPALKIDVSITDMQQFFIALKTIYCKRDFFKQHILLTLMLTLKPEDNFENCVLKLSTFCKKTVSKYGPLSLEYLGEIVPNIRHCYNFGGNMSKPFAKTLLDIDFSPTNQYLSFKIIQASGEMDDDVINRLKTSGDFVIHIELNMIYPVRF